MKEDDDFLDIYDKLYHLNTALSNREQKMSQSAEFKVFETEMSQILEVSRKAHLVEKKKYVSSLEPNHWTKLAIRASLIFLVCLLFAYFVIQQFTKVDLYEQYFESYPIVELTRSSGEMELEKRQGYQLYSEGNYGQAITKLNNYKDYSSIFYKGISHMHLNEYKKALEMFDDITGDDLVYPIMYYKGLCHLRLNNISQAKANLGQINPKFTYYSNKGSEIIMQLD